uniref:Uncharacterized protein n=1 Tax=viral metagenome TaxID=1070528 RepID=A0A6C0BUT4_9ZZZZ
MSGQYDPTSSTLDDIKRLQQMEESLYKELETTSAKQALTTIPNADSCYGYDCTIEGQKCLSGKPGSGNKNWVCKNKKWIVDTPSSDNDEQPIDYGKQGRIMDQIDQLTQMRLNMFKQIQGQFTGDQSDLTGTQKGLASQLALAKVAEAQLTDMKTQVRKLEEMKNDKLRMVEIGSYEAQRYDAYKTVMFYIFLAAVSMVLLNKTAQLGVLPDFLSTGIIAVVLVVAIIMVGRKLLDIGARSPLNFDKYNFSSDLVVQQSQPGYETVLDHDKRAFVKMLYGAETSYDDAKQQLSGYTKSAGEEIQKVYGDGVSAFGLNGSVDRVKIERIAPPSASLSMPNVENFAAF